MGRLEGKVAIITGANSGIGKATAERFALEGADLVLAARRLDKLKEVETYAVAQGVRALSVATDVSQPEDCRRLVEAAVAAFGRIDILVNNAGIDDKNKSITNCDLELWEKVISTDQNSVYFMMKEVLPHMERAGQGSIVNISSIGATRSNAGISYTAAKMAVIGMTKNVAIQYAGTGIRCNAVCPGPPRLPSSPQRTPPPLTRSSHGRAPATSTAQFPAPSLRTKPTPFCFSPVTSLRPSMVKPLW